MKKTELELIVSDDTANRQSREDKDRLFKRYEVIGKSLGSARRLEIIDLLADGPRTVEDVAAATGMSIANASQHLRNLHTAGLLKVKREGSYAYYSLSIQSDITTLWDSLRALAHTVDPGLRFEKLELSAIGPSTLEKKLDDPTVRVVDVRSIHDFNGGRIRKAQSIPLELLEAHLSDLDADCEYVVYDRGGSSPLAGMARTVLIQAGFKVRQLDGGFEKWKAEGRPSTRSIALG
ncbi:MAG: ArsR family transcriptional regulator [Bacteroidetes bacterium]|nr:ArsR family transcriptional regulator [Bacteroidota bacterium]